MDLYFLFAKLMAKIQRPAMRNCQIDKTSRVYEKSELHNVKVGKFTYIGKCSILSDTEIGNFCSIAGYGQIGGGMHPIEMVSTSPCFVEGKSAVGRNFSETQFKSSKRVYIGNDVWIGAGCYIKGGVHIGDGVIIGAHSVVVHDVEPYTIVAGVPARVVRKRFDEETIGRLYKLQWWDWPEEKLNKYGKFFGTPETLLDKIEKGQ